MLGFFSYFRTYIDRFAEVAKPITDLTKKNVSNHVHLTPVHQRAFELLKASLCEATKLHVIEYGKPCGIIADASNTCVRCCLIQWTEQGDEKPIAFASQKLTHTQSMWATIERETNAVVFALKRFRNFIFATKVTIISDSNSLPYLRECAAKSAKLTRWAFGLMEFDLD